jgi:hypothetical protein
MKKSELEKRLTDLINDECRENDSNTPDFLLAEFMMGCLDAFELINNKREVWFGVHLDILNSWEELIIIAMGEASMCWSETPKGVFDSTRALEIGKKLLKDIKSRPMVEVQSSPTVPLQAPESPIEA